MRPRKEISDKIHRLTFLQDLGVRCVNGKRRRIYLVKCDCGVTKEILAQAYGRNVSCGCYHKEVVIRNATKHNMTGTRPLRIFNAMKQRCNNPNNSEYKFYGGKGVSIEWNNFDDFWSDMKDGYGVGLTIERIDNNKNYCKPNCKWATRKEQLRNTSKTLFVYYKGIKYKFIDFIEKFDLPRRFFYYRIFEKGIDLSKALQEYNG